MSYFKGRRRIRGGFSWGGLFRTGIKALAPLFKRGAKYAGKKLLQSGINVASDVLEGRNPEEAFKQQLSKVKKDVMSDIRNKMSGAGKKRAYKKMIKAKKTAYKKKRATYKKKKPKKAKKKTKKKVGKKNKQRKKYKRQVSPDSIF